jgi:hypothetical protein
MGKGWGKAREIRGIFGKQPSSGVPGIKMPGYFREVPPGLETSVTPHVAAFITAKNP